MLVQILYFVAPRIAQQFCIFVCVFSYSVGPSIVPCGMPHSTITVLLFAFARAYSNTIDHLYKLGIILAQILNLATLRITQRFQN